MPTCSPGPCQIGPLAVTKILYLLRKKSRSPLAVWSTLHTTSLCTGPFQKKNQTLRSRHFLQIFSSVLAIMTQQA